SSTARTRCEIYSLSLHDALPISFPDLDKRWRHSRPLWNFFASCTVAAIPRCLPARSKQFGSGFSMPRPEYIARLHGNHFVFAKRSEEHTSELQSRGHLVCRLLLE